MLAIAELYHQWRNVPQLSLLPVIQSVYALNKKLYLNLITLMKESSNVRPSS